MDVQPLHDEAGLGDAVARINQNTDLLMGAIKALQAVSDSYAAALPASVADRAALHRQADATDARLATTITALNGVGTQAAAASTAAAGAASAASSAQAAITALSGKQPRVASGMAPAITSVVTTASGDVTLTWPTPWPDATYTVMAVIEPPASLLGKVSVSVKSKTPATVTLTVTASAVLASGSVPVRAASFP